MKGDESLPCLLLARLHVGVQRAMEHCGEVMRMSIVFETWTGGRGVELLQQCS